ncbi:MAG: response regulator [Planctomycetes bacterium]|nr:response regulator [Planctomycetota bacterium]
MGLVYVIDDESSLREGLLDALGRLEGVQALGFERTQQAVQALDSYPPDLVLTEIHLPERCGLDLLPELDARGLHPQVVLMSSHLEAYREYIPQREGLAVLAKPFDLEVLVAHALQVLPSQPVADGSAPSFGLVDYLKMACVGQHTAEILAFSAGDRRDLVGRVVVLGGTLWSAQDAQGMGADAFLRLTCQPLGEVSCHELQRTALMRNVYQDWQTLISRATRLNEGPATHPHMGTATPPESSNFRPPGPFVPPRPLNCAPAPVESGTLTLQGQEPEVPVLSADAEPTLDDYLAAASAAENGGALADAIQHLERAMVHYPGHPEILLWILRLKR